MNIFSTRRSNNLEKAILLDFDMNEISYHSELISLFCKIGSSVNEKVVKELWIDRNSGGTPKFLVVTRLKSEAEIKKSKNVNKVGYQTRICGHFFSLLSCMF